MISLQNRIFLKLLDDSRLAGSFQSGPGARSLKSASVCRPLRGFPSSGAGGRFCAQRSDFKGLGAFFCNSNRSPRRAEGVSNLLGYRCKYMKVRSKTQSGKAKNATGRTTSSSQARRGCNFGLISRDRSEPTFQARAKLGQAIKGRAHLQPVAR
jgi:hypothetical protein